VEEIPSEESEERIKIKKIYDSYEKIEGLE
jgi:hypothetical protein